MRDEERKMAACLGVVSDAAGWASAALGGPCRRWGAHIFSRLREAATSGLTHPVARGGSCGGGPRVALSRRNSDPGNCMAGTAKIIASEDCSLANSIFFKATLKGIAGSAGDGEVAARFATKDGLSASAITRATSLASRCWWENVRASPSHITVSTTASGQLAQTQASISSQKGHRERRPVRMRERISSIDGWADLSDARGRTICDPCRAHRWISGFARGRGFKPSLGGASLFRRKMPP